jgi:heat shock protein HslJ
MIPVRVLVPLVAFLMLACSELPTLEGRAWTLVELRGEGITPLADLPLPSLRFADGQMTGFTGCNEMFGAYDSEGSGLHFGPIGATRRACPDETELELRFLQALESTTGYAITPGGLELGDGADVIARLAPTE